MTKETIQMKCFENIRTAFTIVCLTLCNASSIHKCRHNVFKVNYFRKYPCFLSIYIYNT